MASAKNALRKVCIQIMEDHSVPAFERLKAAKLLVRLLDLAKKGKSRGSYLARNSQRTEAQDSLARILGNDN